MSHTKFIRTTLLLVIFVLKTSFIQSQSIHQEQSDYYKMLGKRTTAEYDAMNGFKSSPSAQSSASCDLQKLVYGWYPYWGGSTYQNLDYNLLTDFVYFSYEVDVTTGEAITTRDFNTSAAVDYALAQGVRVSLCLTLFSNHSTLYDNPTAQNTLVNNAVSLVKNRGGKGINIDFEAVSSADREKFTAFANQLADHLHAEIPGSILTIALPAVEWSDKFDVVALRDKVDYFVIMGYDYYWKGSAQAGPNDGLYSMESSYNYNLNRSVSYYEAKGIPKQQLLLGLPYYGREWHTAGAEVPSNAMEEGVSRTYKYVRDNSSGYYSSANKRFEENSFSNYYVFQNGAEWRQCWIDDATDISRRMDLINYRDIGGMGIWALGYDDGYNDFWNLIKDKFTSCSKQPLTDSIYDSGGPAFDYYNNEDYTFTIAPSNAEDLTLYFTDFELENNYDYLTIYDGFGTSDLIGQYTGNNSPGVVQSTTGAFTINVTTDGATGASGWKAIWTASGALTLDDFETGVGHFDREPTYSGSTNGTDASSTAERTTTDAKNGVGSLQVSIIDDATSSDNIRVRLLSGSGSPDNNIYFSSEKTIGFWMKTSSAQDNATVALWIDDSDGIEQAAPIAVISDGAWNYYEWDLALVNLEAITGNGSFDSAEVTLDAISFNANANSGDWTLLIDDVKVSTGAIQIPEDTYATLTEEVCEIYTAPGGEVYTSSGTYTDIIPNAAGADSIITINLTVNYNTTTNITVNSTESTYTSPSGKIWTTSGVYMDIIPNAAGCDSIIFINLNFVSTSIEMTDKPETVLFPNPVREVLTIQFNNLNRATIRLYSMTGRLMNTWNLPSQQKAHLDMTAYEPGIYLLQIQNKGSSNVYRIVKE